MKMIRTLLALVLVATLVLAGGAWLNDPSLRRFGQVIVQAGGHDYVATLPKAGLILFIALLLVWLLWTLLAAPLRALVRYRRKRARARLVDGLTALHHGRWQEGEKLLLAAAGDARAAPVALAAALRAADKRGDDATAAAHLQQLQQIDPLRHALLQARRLIVRDQPAEALALLDNPALQPLPPRGQVLRQRCLRALGQPEEAYGLLGTLRSQQALPATQLKTLEQQLAAEMLDRSTDTTLLADRYQALGKPLQTDPVVVAAYARRGMALGWHGAAAHVLTKALAARWSADLVPLWVQATVHQEAAPTLAQLQRWQDEHPGEPSLLLAAGELARRHGELDKAAGLFLQATTTPLGMAAWEALGRLHADAGRHADASTCLRNALNLRDGLPLLAVDNAPAALPEQAVPDIRNAHGLPQLPGTPDP